MSSSLSKLSIEQIRERYARPDRPVTPQTLSKLKRDPRQGVRQIYEALKKRYERERSERQRLDAMLNFERVLWRSGVERIAGVDEAGTGPLAGPVVAAAVVFPPHTELPCVDDSKRLDPEQRAEAERAIRAAAAGIGIGVADVGEIDRINIYQAALLAMRRAVEALPMPPQHVLVDARDIPGVNVPQNRFYKGDGINFSIAAASIIAKTHRDRLMDELAREYPEYGFERHKGYGTPEHQEAIRRHGPCAIHRMSFTFIRELCGDYSPRFYELKHRLERARDHAVLAALEEEVMACRGDLPEEEQRKLRLMLTRRWKTL
ncbi:MAG TPA: ribonuclease HII [Gammaproteobacteria bacterium]